MISINANFLIDIINISFNHLLNINYDNGGSCSGGGSGGGHSNNNNNNNNNNNMFYLNTHNN